MLRALCIPCQHGQHDGHVDVVRPGIDGLIGSGQECPCRGGCVDTRGPKDAALAALLNASPHGFPPPETAGTKRPCPCCEGEGCSECSETGVRVSTFMDLGDGMTARIEGNAELDDEAREAIASVMRAAFEQMAGTEPEGEGTER